jgi:serine/threonine-protein kinase
MSKSDTTNGLKTSSGDDGPAPKTAEPASNVRPLNKTEKVGLIIDGRYRIDGLIGRGGMGSVYRAEHVSIRRQVALKLLHPTLAQVPEVAKRFEREALAIGRISHPNCVDVMDFGTLDDGSLFLVMEYLEGRSLGDELDEMKRIEPLRALHILRHVLKGLGHTHDADIVHRDVKPENVHLVTEGDDTDFAKILDFGIAKLLGEAQEIEGEVKLTQAGVAFGTPVYMSPEQAVGNPVDGRADLYAASLVGFEMITGKTPFYSDDKLEVLSMHTTRPVPAMIEIAPDLQVPREIEELIRRGLAKRPEERFADANEYIAALDAVVGLLTAPRAHAQFNRAGTVPVLYSTGEHGVVVDPMTMTQSVRVATPEKDRKSLLTGVAIAGAIALIAILVAVIAGSGGGDDKAAAPIDAAPPPTLGEKMAELLQKGDPQGVIALAEEDGAALAADPQALLQAGHAYAFRQHRRAALTAYATAVGLDPLLYRDDTMRRNLTVLLDATDSKDPFLPTDAAVLLIDRWDDDDARDKLVELATKEKENHERRQRAFELAEGYGLADKDVRFASFSLDLVFLPTCPKRRAIISKLQSLGDKRAIGVLKKSKAQKWKKQPINQCLIKAANAAIAYLESLPN